MQTTRNLFTFNSNTVENKNVVTGNKALKSVAKLVSFFVLFTFLVLFIEGLLLNTGSVIERKRAIAQRENNSVDIMFIGNSHAYCTYNPAVIEETIDKRVLNAGLPDQKIDLTYYTLLELLNKQSPETIVLDAFAFGRSNSTYKGFVANVDAMETNLDKLKACFEIFPDKYDAFRMSFSIFRDHNNWKKPGLIKENLKILLGRPSKNYVAFDGFYPLDSKMSPDTIEKYRESKTSEFTPVIDAYSIGYFERIVKLCKDRGIKLIITMAPFNELYLEKIQYHDIYNKMAGLCKEEAVEYIDFNMLYDEIGLNYNDFEDAFHNAQHTNKWGAEKVSRYLADYLNSDALQ